MNHSQIKIASENKLLAKLQRSTNPNQKISLYNGNVEVWMDYLIDDDTMEVTSHIRIEAYDKNLISDKSRDMIIKDALSRI